MYMDTDLYGTTCSKPLEIISYDVLREKMSVLRADWMQRATSRLMVRCEALAFCVIRLDTKKSWSASVM